MPEQTKMKRDATKTKELCSSNGGNSASSHVSGINKITGNEATAAKVELISLFTKVKIAEDLAAARLSEIEQLKAVIDGGFEELTVASEKGIKAGKEKLKATKAVTAGVQPKLKFVEDLASARLLDIKWLKVELELVDEIAAIWE